MTTFAAGKQVGEAERWHDTRDIEARISRIVAGVALPGAVAVAGLLVAHGATWEIWMTACLAAVILLAAAMHGARRTVSAPLRRAANLLQALREGNYTQRAVHGPHLDGATMIMQELNSVGSTLQQQRIESLETSALLAHLMEELAVGVFAFDPDGSINFVNRAGAAMVGQTTFVGKPVESLGLGPVLRGPARQLVDVSVDGRFRRYEVRRTSFIRTGVRNHLIVVADLSRTLREEEEAAWQRLVRVLAHEINNSLAPIRSVAHSLGRLVERSPVSDAVPDLRPGLDLIEERAGSLGRFIRSYAQLAGLPKPAFSTFSLSGLVSRVAGLEKRVVVDIRPGPPLTLWGDADQLEQLLINLVRNGTDSALSCQGGVTITWEIVGNWVELSVIDSGTGIESAENLFVPFFTTKASGSGIGLALSRQIAEAHGGTLDLQNRTDHRGCRALVRLPTTRTAPDA